MMSEIRLIFKRDVQFRKFVSLHAVHCLVIAYQASRKQMNDKAFRGDHETIGQFYLAIRPEGKKGNRITEVKSVENCREE